jgi:transcriptional regulator with XRE-family HTH domain
VKPEKLKEIRTKLGLSTVQMGRAFGYSGTDVSVAVNVRKFESGGRTIPPAIARLARMYEKAGGVPEGWIDYTGKFDIL